MKTSGQEATKSGSIALPGATVFFSSACIMILELAASRLVARGIGASIYTWTAVIGVVLAGITTGNYIGGRIADRRFDARTIAELLGIASIMSVWTIVVSNRMGQWAILWGLSWPICILTQITLLLLLPSIFLGAINPVVAKAALQTGRATGRTIGAIYAWGAAGSIAGTFLAGFWLIAAIGATAVFWATASALLIVAVSYSPRFRLLHLWAGMLVILMVLGLSPGKWAMDAGALLTLRAEPDPNTVYEDETQYCHIRVRQESSDPDRRSFFQDKLKHSEVLIGDPTTLLYAYAQIYAAVTEQTAADKKDLRVLAIGGGGYVFPRYIKQRWPASQVDVVEIDAGVTKAATAAFGLPKDSGINTFTMDGRNFVDGLAARKRSGEPIQYDFIYGDAYDNFTVPYQLVTREFNEKVAQILSSDGFYMLNLIEVFDSGLMLGGVINTLSETFSNIYVLSPHFDYCNRATFVIIASRRTLDAAALAAEVTRRYGSSWCLSKAQIQTLRNKCGGIVLTDDYAPVDNLVAPIARDAGAAMIANIYSAHARSLSAAGQWEECVELYMKAIRIHPTMPLKAYYEIGQEMLAHHEYQEALVVCQKALECYDRPETRQDLAPIHFNTGLTLKAQGQTAAAREHLNKAIEGYKREMQEDANSTDTLANLGVAFAEYGNMGEATRCFEQVIRFDPANPEYRFMLARALLEQRRYAQAETMLREAIDFMTHHGNKEAVSTLEGLLRQITYDRSAVRQ